jgi:hypothetical protein
MSSEKQGTFAKVECYLGRSYVAIPLLALLGTAFLHWTMQVFLEPNLLMRLAKLVVLPIYIPIVIAGPPGLIALGIWYFIRRVESVFWIVLIVGVLVWGFWYMLPPIIENWESFMRFVDDFGAV